MSVIKLENCINIDLLEGKWAETGKAVLVRWVSPSCCVDLEEVATNEYQITIEFATRLEWAPQRVRVKVSREEAENLAKSWVTEIQNWND